MSRTGAWKTAWNNFISSLYGGAVRKKRYVGTDKFGNRYYEFEHTRLNVKRGYESPEDVPNPMEPQAEWRAWVKSTRRFPPSEEEIFLTEAKTQAQAQLLKNAEMEKLAPKVGSTGKGAADVDRSLNFPIYDDIEIGAGVKQQPAEKKKTNE